MVGKAKRIIKKQRSFLKSIKTWQLILILIPLLFIEATLLRFDHIKMTELKSAVLAADKEGNDERISDTLNALRDFTFSHTVINITEKNGENLITFGTGPFYLEQQYLRKTAAILEQAEGTIDDSNPNGNVYSAAMSICQPKAQLNGWAWNNPEYLNCYLTEINKYPTSERIEDSIVVSLPDTNLYRYNFASPIWTPTLSGFVAIFCLILILIIIVRFFAWIFVKIAILFIR